MLGKNWAMPVTSRPWAFIATILDFLKVRSGYRILRGSAHRAWERAVAPPKGWEYEQVVEGTSYNGIMTLRRS